MSTNEAELLDVVIEAATSAGLLLKEKSRGPARGISTKSTPTDLVSDADRAAEELILELISARRPHDGVVAEEGGRERSSSGLTWVVDPLDGTVNFLYGIPAWCVSIAVKDASGPLIGVVHDPNRNETFSATRGGGARLNDSPIHVGSVDDIAQALVGTGFAYDAEARSVQAERLPRVLPAVRDLRRAGSAALDLSWLACGRLDGFFEAPMHEWDKAAGILLIQEAGGVVSELPGPPGHESGVIAAGPALHDALRALVLG